jgi:hypothetical protein
MHIIVFVKLPSLVSNYKDELTSELYTEIAVIVSTRPTADKVIVRFIFFIHGGNFDAV